jgi:hypothetical protein
MAILYYNAAVDNDWNTLGNWWTSDAFTTQAAALPTSSDSVILSASVGSNSGSAPTVVNLTSTGNINIPFTVTGTATFNGGGPNSNDVGTTMTGNFVFNNDAGHGGGTIVGNVTFNDDSYTYSAITGNITLYDRAQNGSTTTGNAVFNDESRNSMSGNVTGTATFNDLSYIAASSGITGPCTFYDYSYNRGSALNAVGATFFDYSYSDGGISNNGSETFNDNSRCISGGTGGNNYVFATFNDNSLLEGSPNGGTAVFNDTARASFSGPISEATFNDRSYGSGTAAIVTINGGPISTTGMTDYSGGGAGVDFNFTRAQLGINGSSILGVI